MTDPFLGGWWRRLPRTSGGENGVLRFGETALIRWHKNIAVGWSFHGRGARDTSL